MSFAVSLLQNEYKNIKKKGLLSAIGGSAGPVKKTNFKHWVACFIGPAGTPYEGGLFYIEIKMTDKYPVECPKVRMRTKTYHANIFNDQICVDYLTNWKSENNIVGLVNAIFALLATPNPSDGYHVNNDEEARNYTNQYAVQSQEYNYDENW